MSEDINSQTENVPNPGSDEAIEIGCSCPAYENYYGRGIEAKEGTQFWINENCPIHGKGNWDEESS